MGTLPPPVRLQVQELVAGSLEEMGAHFEDTVAKFWDYLESDGTMNELVMVRKCATRYKYEHTIAAVNQAIVERLTRTGKKLLFNGASNVDWSTASEDSNTYEKIPRPMLARLGMHYGPHGLLVPGSPAPEVPGRVEEEGDERCACTAPEEWVADLEGEGESSSTRSIELLSFHQYGSIGLCFRHVNMLAALFGLKTPIEPKEQVRRLARL